MVLALVAMNIYLGKVITQEFNISMSVKQYIYALQNKYITMFSVLQYSFVVTLFIGLGSVIQFK